MAEARLIKKKVSLSERVNALPGDAAYLYILLILHVDRDGRYSGNPKIIKRDVIPLRDCTEVDIEKWLNTMEDSKDPMTGEGLIERYTVKGIHFIWMPGFMGEQGQSREPNKPAAWYLREAESDNPPPPSQRNKPLVVKKAEVEVPIDKTDPVLAKMVIAWENYSGNPCTPNVAEELKLARDIYPEGLFEKAIKEAELKAAGGRRPSLKYILKIMENWKADGKAQQINGKILGDASEEYKT